MRNWKNTLKNIHQRIKDGKLSRMIINSSSVSKLAALNLTMYLIWKFKGVPQIFLVKHFSFNQFNIQQNRFYTMLTYAFSHTGLISLLFQLVIIASFGRIIKLQFSNKMVWWTYLLGSICGGLSMNFLMREHPTLVIPQIGSQAATTSMMTFYGLLNLRKQVILFMYPIPMWSLLLLLGVFSLFDQTRKTFGGVMGGLIAYQLFMFNLIL